MDPVALQTEGLISAIRSSGDYQRYKKCEEQLRQNPELKKKVDEYRVRNFQLQQTDRDLFDESDEVLREFGGVLKNPLAAEYLDAESSVCRMVQRVVNYINKSVAVDIPEMEKPGH